MKTQIIIFDKQESVIESVCKDAVTFAFLALCIWFSQSEGGGWWTFMTSTMFLLVLAVKLPGDRNTKLSSKREAVEWANQLPEDAP